MGVAFGSVQVSGGSWALARGLPVAMGGLCEAPGGSLSTFEGVAAKLGRDRGSGRRAREGQQDFMEQELAPMC